VTAVGVLIGVCSARYAGAELDLANACVTLVFALVAHAGVNVLNDYFDALSGTDQRNVLRIYPFTGGSRFIQNGVLSLEQTRRLGYALLTLAVPAGLVLAWQSGPGLLLIGLAGLLIGWAYSAPPLKLNSRGLGELCVSAGFLCVVVGSDYVQRRAFSATAFAAGIPYSLMVTNVLFMNQFPDRQADLEAGKLHWVARLDPRQARWGYPVIAMLAAAALLTGAVPASGRLPRPTLLALLALAPAAVATRDLFRFAHGPQRLAPAIKATVAAAILHGMLLSAGLLLSDQHT
jgi:1,4-dihydroxy-2-naphthoate octaprenyltransferase